MNDEQIFARAVQLSGDERIQFIAQSCGQDPVQRERMEKLLAAHETPDSLLAVDGISSTTAFVNDDSVGQQIGSYKLLQKLGEGGMGAVYLAERQRPVKQRVALKIIKHGMDSKKFVARFEAERQALAMMDHPNIASVHDAGCTQSGRPYLVMELVKGVPITTFCDQNKLSTRERLELFIPVCHAVQHAHRKGIIHRDLKPSNILVAMYDDRPVPKVIDFGLAKAANQQLTDKTLFTEVGSILGTWEYMSPEQAVLNQLDVDTRTDVYALGVILYELLTGVTPLDRKQLREVQLRETLRIIQDVDPPKPSTRVSGLGAAVSAVATYRSTDAAGLSKAIRGDLDWVTMKALEKDRRRRYEAASRLADDVAHVLAGEAVDARPPSLAYTTSKLWNRHRLPISTAALVLCLLVIVSIVTSSLEASK
jgi:serine/threonine protein kinase